LQSVVSCPYKTVRVAEGGDSPQEEEDEEIEQSNAKVKRRGAFDFGTAWSDGSGTDDDWSEDSGSKEEEAPAPQPSASIFEKFRVAVVDALSLFFGGSRSPDPLAAAFALRHGGFDVPVDLLTEDLRRQAVAHISAFIDSCMSLFFDSASVPLGPRDLVRLCHLLLKLINPASDLTADFSSPPVAVPFHSVFGGAVAVALWSHMDGLLASLLGDPPFLPRLDPASVPPGVSSLAVDYATPQFSESIPRLFARYLSAMATGSHALEYTRFLLMYILFRRIHEVALRFSHVPWVELVRARVEAMTRSFELWQIALRFPLLEPPPSAGTVNGGVARLIDSVHASALSALLEVQAHAKRRLGFPPVFACGAPSADLRPALFASDIAGVRAIAFMPGSSNKMVIVGSEGRVFKVIDGQVSGPLEKLANVTAVIVHPIFPIFLTLSSSDLPVASPSLHHFDQGQVGPCSFRGTRPTCGAFSPTGSKFALCGDVVNIYSVDLTKTAIDPAIPRELKAPVTAVAWLNSDTMLAVAYPGNLIIVDTFSRYHIPIELKREWGSIAAMTIEAKSGRLVSVTRGGFLVVWDLRQSYAQSYPRLWTSGPVSAASVSSAAELVVFSLDRSIFLFHMADLQNVAELQVPPDIKIVSSVAIAEDRIAATADPSRLLFWEGHRRD
jgi:hypothetical protein